MKIRTDVEQILQSRPPVHFANTQHNQILRPQPAQAAARTVDQSVMDRLSMERSLNDALNIAQMSHSLLQKAMTVSSRLRSIAEQTIVTGRTDHDELISTIADIQASMQQYGEIVAPPPVNATGGGPTPDIPQVRHDIGQVVEAADQYAAGTVPDIGAMDELNTRLSSQSAQAGQAIMQLQGQLQELMGGYQLPAGFDAAAVIPATSSIITLSPSSALGVQGNISRDAATRLLGA